MTRGALFIFLEGGSYMGKIKVVNKIKMLAVEDIKGYENNPRRIEGGINSVANSIKEFGFKVPIIIDKENVIVAGHTRLAAAQKLGLKEVPCIVADDLNDEQIRAFRLADNKTAELSGWDFEKLEEEIAGLTDFDMSAFGFDDDEEEVNPGAFFTEAEPAQTVEKGETQSSSGTHTIICPDCGAEIEVDSHFKVVE